MAARIYPNPSPSNDMTDAATALVYATRDAVGTRVANGERADMIPLDALATEAADRIGAYLTDRAADNFDAAFPSEQLRIIIAREREECATRIARSRGTVVY